jgi:hypothetical protein
VGAWGWIELNVWVGWVFGVGGLGCRVGEWDVGWVGGCVDWM